jgi:hypothetical protein
MGELNHLGIVAGICFEIKLIVFWEQKQKNAIFSPRRFGM